MPEMPLRQAAADVLLWIESDTRFLVRRRQEVPELPLATRSVLEAVARGEAVDVREFEQALNAAQQFRQQLSFIYLKSSPDQKTE